jgi:CHASE2 domain-containing sensor protein/tRNA A-37 threonylcarbamoyl transferase component Bud32
MDRKRLKFSALVAGALFLILGILTYFNVGWFEKLEVPLYDIGAWLRVRNAPQEEPKIVVIELDQKGFDASGSTWYDEEVIDQLVTLLTKGKAKVIGIDLPLGQTGLNQGLKDLRRIQERIRDYGRGRQKAGLPDWLEEDLNHLESQLAHSADLAKHVNQAGNTILAIYPSWGETGSGKQRGTVVDGSLERNYLNTGASGEAFPHQYQVTGNLIFPATSLCEAALGLGCRLATLKPGLVGRAHPILANYKGHLLPSFALRVTLAYLNLAPKEVVVGPDELRLGDRRVPLYDGDILVAPIISERVVPRLSCSELLAGKSIPKTLAGKITLISLAPPLAGTLPGAIGLPDPAADSAEVVQSILTGSWIKRPGFARYLELGVLFFVLALGTVFSSLKSKPIRLISLSILTLASILVGVGSLFAAGIWLKTVHVAVALVLLSLAVGIRPLFAISVLRRELEDTHKLLGLHYRKEGELDQALEEFSKCRQDPEIKELLYDLGLDYEKNAMWTQALRSYETLRQIGRYKDVDERMTRLGAPGKPLPFDAGETKEEKDVLSDSFIRMNRAVGRYQIVSELGKGTMGVVYKAKDPKINRFVAIKVIRFSDDFDEDVLSEVKNRFLREAEIAGQLSHPSIITVFDVGEDQDLTYMAMEYLEGKSLSHYCKRETLIPVPRAVEIIKNIAEALDHAHKAKVIHRDIKPANIMILNDGGVKVTDFGIAKAISSSLTKTGIVLGTPNYMSPEQIMGHSIGPRTDIFSLGVLFFHLVTGELPFRGEKLNTLLYQITQAKHPSVRSINPSLPKAVEQIIDKALAKNPDHRFKSAGEMAKYLGLLRSKIDQAAQAKSGSATGPGQQGD